MVEQQFLPVHVGIIIDGNGRWAKKRALPRKMGHKAGAEVFRKIALYANDRGLKYLTFYVFSTENWKRPEDEVHAIIRLLRNYLDEVDQYRDKNIRIRFLGDLSVFEPDIQKKMGEIQEESAGNTGMTLNLAINYGGRDEIVHAARRLAEQVKAGRLAPEDITEQLVTENLYAGDEPDVDLIIRPSGEYRLSNFLIWQSAYAEYVFMDEVLWPDFTPAHLEAALTEYHKRDRRFGGI